MTLQHAAYRAGWQCAMAGNDPRYCNPFTGQPACDPDGERYAWDAGALDAMAADDGETPDPQAAGF